MFEDEGSREVSNIPEPPRVVSLVSRKPSIVSHPDPLSVSSESSLPLPSSASSPRPLYDIMPSPHTSPLYDLDSSPVPEFGLLDPSGLVSSGSDSSFTISPEVLDDLEAYSNALGSQDSHSPSLTCFEKSNNAPTSISSALYTESRPNGVDKDPPFAIVPPEIAPARSVECGTPPASVLSTRASPLKSPTPSSASRLDHLLTPSGPPKIVPRPHSSTRSTRLDSFSLVLGPSTPLNATAKPLGCLPLLISSSSDSHRQYSDSPPASSSSLSAVSHPLLPFSGPPTQDLDSPTRSHVFSQDLVPVVREVSSPVSALEDNRPPEIPDTSRIAFPVPARPPDILLPTSNVPYTPFELIRATYESSHSSVFAAPEQSPDWSVCVSSSPTTVSQPVRVGVASFPVHNSIHKRISSDPRLVMRVFLDSCGVFHLERSDPVGRATASDVEYQGPRSHREVFDSVIGSEPPCLATPEIPTSPDDSYPIRKSGSITSQTIGSIEREPPQDHCTAVLTRPRYRLMGISPAAPFDDPKMVLNPKYTMIMLVYARAKPERTCMAPKREEKGLHSCASRKAACSQKGRTDPHQSVYLAPAQDEN